MPRDVHFARDGQRVLAAEFYADSVLWRLARHGGWTGFADLPLLWGDVDLGYVEVISAEEAERFARALDTILTEIPDDDEWPKLEAYVQSTLPPGTFPFGFEALRATLNAPREIFLARFSGFRKSAVREIARFCHLGACHLETYQ